MKTKKLLSVIITLAMVLSLLPMTASAISDSGLALRYNESTGKFEEFRYDGEAIDSSTTEMSNGTYVVWRSVSVGTITVTGNVSLILKEGQTLYVNGGIRLSENANLSIYSTSETIPGVLVTKGAGASSSVGYDGWAGIGGGGGFNSEAGSKSSITIHGGKITATGGAGAAAAGIGGCLSTLDMSITIYGGTVNAVGDNYTGIGGGMNSKIKILGGDVTATGYSNRPTIGGIRADIIIGGGNITATHFTSVGGSAEAIGGNDSAVHINGGTINAKSNSDLAAIGGENATVSVGENVTLIDKTSSKVIQSYESWTEALRPYNSISLLAFKEGTPISYMTYDEEDETFVKKECSNYDVLKDYQTTELTEGWYAVVSKITLSQTVTVIGDVSIILMDGANLNSLNGINVEENSSLKIYSQNTGSDIGSVTAKGEDGQAGIGSAVGKNCGSITVYGGNITATGGAGASAVGGNNAELILYGGTVNATGDSVRAINADISVINCRMKDNTTGKIIEKGENESWSDILSASFAWFTAESMKYIPYRISDSKGVYHTEYCTDAAVITKDTAKLGDGWYVLENDVTTYKGLTVYGDAHLILMDNTTLLIDGKGLTVYGSLTVYAQSEGANKGKLTSYIDYSEYNCAISCTGAMTVYGGDLNLIGSNTDSGIGEEGSVTILGGKVHVASQSSIRAISEKTYFNIRGTVTDFSGNPIVKSAATWRDHFGGKDVSFCVDPAYTPTNYTAYDEESGSYIGKSCEEYIPLSEYRLPLVEGTNILNDGWYLADISLTYNEPINVSGDVHLIIADGVTLTANAGIRVPEESSLTVYSTVYNGRINAKGSQYCAGIGGADGESCGNITIHGGDISALGGANAAGIGGGNNGNGGKVTLYGGKITATAGENAQRGIGAGAGGSNNGKLDIPTVPEKCVLCNGDDYSLIEKDDKTQWIDLFCDNYVSFCTIDINKFKKVEYLSFDTENMEFSAKNANCRILDSSDKSISGNWVVDKNLELTEQLFINNDAKLILMDNCTLKANNGIVVTEGNSLTIYAQSDGENMGRIIATGSYGYFAGIGSGRDTRYGSITICGGNIEATGGLQAAGIGGGMGGGSGNIIICGGKITASGQYGAAGIGDGINGSDSNIVIYGGNITASSASNASAIGSSKNNNCTITIADNVKKLINNKTGEPIEKEDGQSWADVFSAQSVSFKAVTYFIPYLVYNTDTGMYDTEMRHEKDCVMIDSNTTKWEDGKWYVADGKGITIGSVTVNGDVKLVLEDGCELTVTDGISVSADSSLTIYAQSEGEHTGKLITTGSYGSAGIGGEGKIIIHGGNIKAEGGTSSYGIDGGAGIGNGAYGGGCDVTIYGGTIEANGADGGAGIGSGYYAVDYDYDFDWNEFNGLYNNGTAGNIIIYGGNITATGGYNAAGIGGGYGCDGGNIAIHGGTVTATGGENSGYYYEDHVGGIGGGWFDVTDDWWNVYYSDEVGDGTLTIDGGAVVFSNGELIFCIHNYEETYSDNGDGKHLMKCSKCGAYGNPTDHIFDDEFIDNGDGTHSQNCKYCGAQTETAEHDFQSGIYKDNEDGTHSQKCKRCEAYDTPEKHNVEDGECTSCTFPYKTIKLSDETEITYDYTKFVIGNNGVLTQYKASEEVVVIPDNVKQIGNNVFQNNKTIKEVNIPASVETIGNSAFYLSGLTKVTFEKGSHLTTIGASAFRDSQLTSFTVPAYVKTIGETSIGGISSLTELIFEEGSQLETIREYAFSTDNLTTVNIPKTVKSIGLYAFANNPISSVYVNWKETSQIASLASDFSDNTYSNGTLYVPYGTTNLYKAHVVWGKFQNIVEMEPEPDSLSLTVTGKTFTVTPGGGDAGTGIVMVALYDSEDMKKLLEVQTFDLAKGDEPEGEFTQSGYVRAYWWSSLGNIKPLCKPKDGTIAK